MNEGNLVGEQNHHWELILKRSIYSSLHDTTNLYMTKFDAVSSITIVLITKKIIYICPAVLRISLEYFLQRQHYYID